MFIWTNGFGDADVRTSALKYDVVVVVGYMEWCERVNREMSYDLESFKIRLQKGERKEGREEENVFVHMIQLWCNCK